MNNFIDFIEYIFMVNLFEILIIGFIKFDSRIKIRERKKQTKDKLAN